VWENRNVVSLDLKVDKVTQSSTVLGSECSGRRAWRSWSWWTARSALESLMTECLERVDMLGCGAWDMPASTCSEPWKWARLSCWCGVRVLWYLFNPEKVQADKWTLYFYLRSSKTSKYMHASLHLLLGLEIGFDDQATDGKRKFLIFQSPLQLWQQQQQIKSRRCR